MAVTVRMYQVGFGDCFLVSVRYPEPLEDGRDSRHILIDFGSTRAPWRGASLVPIAKLVAQHCDSKLDVIVVTHRHKDHVSAFGSDEPAAVIDALSPSLIVRPWTDNPHLASDATGPVGDAGSRDLVRQLHAAEEFAAETARSLKATKRRGLVEDVADLADDQVPNRDAIDQLERWAAASSASYVAYGDDSGIEEVVPGIRARVLGPPTVEQWPEMLKQRATDPDEFWMLNARALTDQLVAGSAVSDDSVSATPIPLGPISWLVEKLERDSFHLLRRIVRSVDDALNNTSVILLLEIGNKRLLFPGDAQIENWSYALTAAPDHEEVRSLLSEIDFYKVGHHGSRNATPKSLFNLWGGEGRPMLSYMSTRSGVHGHTEATKVPRSTLVAALEHRTLLVTTDGLEQEQLFVEATTRADGDEPLKVVEP